MSASENNIKVSIIMMAYNQAKFIDKAIDSVIKQILNYDWELLIADDASNDDTSEIVKKWVKKYQSNIFYHQNEKNIGLQKNYVKIRNKCNGQYIAHLEADDYWIDPMKTSKQIKLLDEHPDMTWCFTNGQKIDNQGKLIKEINNNLPSSFDFYFFLKNKLNPLNNSIIYRNNLNSRTFPKYFFSIIQWDVVLMYQMSLNSIIGFVPVNGLAWRRHENATSFSKEFTGYKRYKDWIIINEEMKKILDVKFHDFFSNKYAYEFLMLKSLKNNKIMNFFYYLSLFLVTRPVLKISYLRDVMWKLRNVNK